MSSFLATGLKPPAKLGAPGSSKASDRNASGKPDRAPETGPMATDERTTGVMGMDPLGIAGVPMPLGSQQGPMGDMDPAVSGAGEGDGDKASPSKV